MPTNTPPDCDSTEPAHGSAEQAGPAEQSTTARRGEWADAGLDAFDTVAAALAALVIHAERPDLALERTSQTTLTLYASPSTRGRQRCGRSHACLGPPRMFARLHSGQRRRASAADSRARGNDCKGSVRLQPAATGAGMLG